MIRSGPMTATSDGVMWIELTGFARRDRTGPNGPCVRVTRIVNELARLAYSRRAVDARHWGRGTKWAFVLERPKTIRGMYA